MSYPRALLDELCKNCLNKRIDSTHTISDAIRDASSFDENTRGLRAVDAYRMRMIAYVFVRAAWVVVKNECGCENCIKKLSDAMYEAEVGANPDFRSLLNRDAVKTVFLNNFGTANLYALSILRIAFST